MASSWWRIPDDPLVELRAVASDEHAGDLDVSLATVIELFLVEERFAFDRERALTAILEPPTYPGDPDVVYVVSENVDEGLNTFEAFHAAVSGGSIISRDPASDELGGVRCVRLEPEVDDELSVAAMDTWQ